MKLCGRVSLQMHQALDHYTELACCIDLTSLHLILLFVSLFFNKEASIDLEGTY